MKVGDRVYFRCNKKRFLKAVDVEGFGVLQTLKPYLSVSGEQCKIFASDFEANLGGFVVDFILPEALYNSPLYQALS